ncbi:hypothetical protein [Okeania sp. SIO2B3]|uniref:hypothetical protein n=1 Tax=Okeania sp. SIO2B3 TaxID=2607784 RepID=UPI0025F52D53|nr:hypothetical protein [Okeania sp. SIO2B3]
MGKHTVDAGFRQFRSILSYVGKQQGVYVAQVDHKGIALCAGNRQQATAHLGE